MRLLLAAAAGFALAVVPALAATDHAVQAVDGNQWKPATIEIEIGDRVVWSNPSGGFHNVSFQDGSGFKQPPAPASTWPGEVSRTFDAAGSYAYLCDAHPNMQGTVVVKAAQTTGTTTTTTTTTTTATGTTPTTTQTTPAAPAEAEAPVTVEVLSRTLRRRRALRLRVGTERARTLAGTVRRSGRLYGRLRLGVLAGERTYRILRTRGGRRFHRGRYALTLRAEPGAPGLPVTVRFRVR